MITRNFSRREFECQCHCGLADPHPALVISLQRLRDILRAPITVTSGCRCAWHNGVVAGADDSQHLPRPEHDGYCCAVDIVMTFSLRDVVARATALEAFAGGGIGVYVDQAPRLHLDVRGIAGLHQPARWARIDGEEAGIEAALEEDAKRRSVTT